MFGLFKKKKEINLNNLADHLISESLWFAAKVEGELPKKHSDNELENFLVKRIQLWEQGKSTHSSYVKAHKIAFEYVLIVTKWDLCQPKRSISCVWRNPNPSRSMCRHLGTSRPT